MRGYLLNLFDLSMSDVVSWWRYATPVFSAFLGISVVLGLIVTRGTTPPEAPVLPAARRTWLSFSPRRGIIGASIALLVLVATTIAAGLASSPDGQGRYIWLAIPVPNEVAIDPIRPWFYGWAYGVPVLICVAVLTAVTWAVLHTNAARPYIRPETVTAERDAASRGGGRSRADRDSGHAARAGRRVAVHRQRRIDLERGRSVARTKATPTK